MATDIAELSVRELDALIAKAKQRRTVLVKRKPIAVVRKRIAALAAAEGYSLTELAGGASKQRTPTGVRAPAKTGRKLGKVPPKYRNPANRQETWTGRGMQPRWLAALVEQGRKVEEFLIEKAGGVRKSTSRSKRPAAKKATKKTARKGVRNAAAKRARKAVGPRGKSKSAVKA